VFQPSARNRIVEKCRFAHERGLYRTASQLGIGEGLAGRYN
jgi:hypothetical protein